MSENEFLTLILDRIDNLIPKITIHEPLIEIATMIRERLTEINEANKVE